MPNTHLHEVNLVTRQLWSLICTQNMDLDGITEIMCQQLKYVAVLPPGYIIVNVEPNIYNTKVLQIDLLSHKLTNFCKNPSKPPLPNF